MTSWRLIPLLDASGVVQMAIDSWLLQQHQQGKHPSTLRFYTWSPVAISLGYHQSRYPSFWRELTWQNQPVQLIRRPTGGRAVLHQGDLTYMVVTSDFSGNTLEVYQQICQFLIAGWRSLGYYLNFGQGGKEYIKNCNCFNLATGIDLVDEKGKKIIGSAQLRKGKAVLQHGSMMINPDTKLYKQVFGQKAPQKTNLNLEQGVEELMPHLVKIFTQAASKCFNIDLGVQPLSESEWEQIKGLGEQKY